MKIIKSITIITLLFCMNFAIASHTETDPKKTAVLKELASLLKNPAIKAGEKDLKAKVYFMINRENEIVVLQVEAENDLVESYIKSRLNYKEMKCKELNPGKEYVFPVRIKS